MAAEIRVDPMSPVASAGLRPPSDAKPELVNKIEGSAEEINAAVFISGQDGVLSVSSDRSALTHRSDIFNGLRFRKVIIFSFVHWLCFLILLCR